MPRQNKNVANLVRGNRRLEHRVIGRPVDSRLAVPVHEFRINQANTIEENKYSTPVIRESNLVRRERISSNEIEEMIRGSNVTINNTNLNNRNQNQVSNNSPFPNPRERNLIRPPSNSSSRIGSSNQNLRNNGNMIMSNLNRNTAMNFNPIRQPNTIQRDLFEDAPRQLRQLNNLNVRPYENLIRQSNFEEFKLDFLNDPILPNRNYAIDSNSDTDSEGYREHRFEYNLEQEIEDLLSPDLQFQANVNDFRSNNRANQLRNLSNNNRIQQQLQNRQQPMRHGNQVAIPITENINLGMNRMRGGLQAMRRRLDDLDSILDDIDSFQVETDQLVRNIQFIENIVERGQEDKKLGLTEAGFKKQKKITYKKKDGQDTCSICIKNVAVDEQVYELICKHVFHEDCIDTWFKQSHLCPNCRKDLN
eukprot:403336896